ncbi:hypothetical protein LXL04_002747 [Taraxacum kok-saghyz]
MLQVEELKQTIREMNLMLKYHSNLPEERRSILAYAWRIASFEAVEKSLKGATLSVTVLPAQCGGARMGRGEHKVVWSDVNREFQNMSITI